MIKDKHLPAMQGMFPSWITSCSKDGEPNTTVISQIWNVIKNYTVKILHLRSPSWRRRGRA